MRVLFINTYDTIGGSAITAYRLNKGLEKYFKTENFMIVSQKASKDPNIFSSRSHKSLALSELKTFTEFLIDRSSNKLGLQYQYFPFSSRFILKKTRSLKPDVISLHNTHGGYFKTALLKRLSKIAPIAWTLHDMWSFTGNAAHTFGDESWKKLGSGKEEKNTYPSIGINLGSWLLRQKRKIYKQSRIHVIVPSHWLYQLARESPVFKGKSISHIYHGVDLNVFQRKDKLCCRKALGIREDARVLIFSSADDLAKSHWKGGQLLVDVLSKIDSITKHMIDILIVGRGRLEALDHLKNLNIHRFGYIESEDILTILLSASDLMIHTSRADSLGLVLIEANACGTPCITFDVGGCREVIQNGVNGYLIKPFDSEKFALKTLETLNNYDNLELFSTSSREITEAHFSLYDMAKNYYSLFLTLINKV